MNSIHKCNLDGSTKRARWFFDVHHGIVYVKKAKRQLYLGIEPLDKYGPAKLYLVGKNDSLDKWLFV